MAKRRDVIVVFLLHNFRYESTLPFLLADHVAVPSQYAREFYWKQLGLSCQHLPYAIEEERVRVESWTPRYVTFVNPQRSKGSALFARIVQVMGKRRPDIPFLVVTGRAQENWAEEVGLELKGGERSVEGREPESEKFTTRSVVTTLEARDDLNAPHPPFSSADAVIDVSGAKLRHMECACYYEMPAMPDPRKFYAQTKLLLMPSIEPETFGLVAAEAMMNGIPVLASKAGALPEVVGDAGFLFDVPGDDEGRVFGVEGQSTPPGPPFARGGNTTAESTPPGPRLAGDGNTTAEGDEYKGSGVRDQGSGKVSAWVETIEQLWDDPQLYAARSEQARLQAQRWGLATSGPQIVDWFANLAHQPAPPILPTPG
jgi:hypothetical protein